MIAGNASHRGEPDDWALSAVLRVIENSEGYDRFCGICMMALIVGRYEDQDVQERAEDLLAAEIARARLNPAEVEFVRSFRMGRRRPI